MVFIKQTNDRFVLITEQSLNTLCELFHTIDTNPQPLQGEYLAGQLVLWASRGMSGQLSGLCGDGDGDPDNDHIIVAKQQGLSEVNERYSTEKLKDQ